MIYRIVTYWKSDDLYCVFDIGAFEDEARANEIATNVTSLQSFLGRAVVQVDGHHDIAVDNAHAIFYKLNQAGKVDLDFDLPGDLDWLLENGREFIEAARPVVTRNRRVNIGISDAGN